MMQASWSQKAWRPRRGPESSWQDIRTPSWLLISHPVPPIQSSVQASTVPFFRVFLHFLRHRQVFHSFVPFLETKLSTILLFLSGLSVTIPSQHPTSFDHRSGTIFERCIFDSYTAVLRGSIRAGI
ncbi:hypothetical protein BR93DRAFT_605197 [Coniochaeta sp. PMI_546]|nr:hypothetical protein BR93DRAFT_605197 [Coniochaeta sp. PMI_546]